MYVRTVHGRQAARSGIRDALGDDHEGDADARDDVILQNMPWTQVTVETCQSRNGGVECNGHVPR
jgi:hypothetical protein